MEEKESLRKELSDCVFDMRDEDVAEACENWIEAGYDPAEGIFEGLVDGMNRASRMYDEGEYFVPELLCCAEAMDNGLEVLRSHIDVSDIEYKCKVAIGVVEGDTHDLGKDLVKIMLESSGYDVIDLGRDVETEAFITTIKEHECKLVCLSTLMSTSMVSMRIVVERICEAGMRDDVKIIIGGGPLSQKFADEIGADAYAQSASDTVRIADELLGFES